jgi:dTDP-4-dehydrorhamnose reductase
MSNTIIGTGLTGLVGSRLVDLYKDTYTFENIDLATGVDITKLDQVEKAIGESKADTVVHFAAFTNVSGAYDQTGDEAGACYQVNVVGTKNIAIACKKFGKYLVHISTDFIFDGVNPSETGYTENDVPQPIEWYGKTKFLAEEEVKISGATYTILRLAYPYRAFHEVRPDIVRNIIAKLKEGKMYPPFADHTITPTFIDDIANVINLVIEKKPVNESFHLVGSSWHTDYEIALLVQEVFGLPGEIKPGSLEEYLKTANRPYQKTMRVSNQKLQTQLGYTPKTLKEGLEAVKAQMEKL